MTHHSLSSLKLTMGALSLALLGSGCAEKSIRTLHSMEPQGSELARSLAKEYEMFASDELHKNYDEFNAYHFANKGIEAAEGKEVMPESLCEHDLPTGSLPELKAARGSLLHVLKTKEKDCVAPELAAAQVSFDRWVEEQEERWETKDIAAARQRFHHDMKRVHAAIKAHKHAHVFHVHFAVGSDMLNHASTHVLARAYKLAHKHSHCSVVLKGFTDASGSKHLNKDLSERRAASVKKALVGMGVAEHRIMAEGLGVAKHSAKNDSKHREVKVTIH